MSSSSSGLRGKQSNLFKVQYVNQEQRSELNANVAVYHSCHLSLAARLSGPGSARVTSWGGGRHIITNLSPGDVGVRINFHVNPLKRS